MVLKYLELVRWCEVKIIIEFYFFYNEYITCYIFNCIKYLTTDSYRIAIYFKTIYYVMLYIWRTLRLRDSDQTDSRGYMVVIFSDLIITE
jgi:hypothetical protein